MADNQPTSIDTRDMVALHSAFKRALNDAPYQIESVSEGDALHAQRIADYLDEVLWLLHAHHLGEDELLYPLLATRVAEIDQVLGRMDAQHVEVAAGVEATQHLVNRFRASAARADGRELADACTSLSDTLAEHASDEEQEILPLAQLHISPPEWGALPGHAMSSYTGSRMWLPFGLAVEAMPDDIKEGLLAHLPPPVAAMWFGGGEQAFSSEMEFIRGS